MSQSPLFQLQNKIQRAGLAGALLCLLLLIVLHNPLDGYTTETYRHWSKYEETPNVCTKEEYAEGRNLLTFGALSYEEYISIFGPPVGSEKWTTEDRQNFQVNRLQRTRVLVRKCFHEVEGVVADPIPFDEWRSDGPLVNWLGSIVHLIGMIFVLVIATVGWLVIFREQNQKLPDCNN